MSLQLAHSDAIGNPVARYVLDSVLRPVNLCPSALAR